MPRSPRQAVDHNAMTFGEHLEELRSRLIVALLGLLPIILVAFGFGTWLLDFLVVPAQVALRERGLPPMLQATGPLETFGAYMRVAFIAAIVVGSPWLLWQLWIFVAPGLYERERRFVYLLAPLSATLTAIGCFFLYTVMLPVVLTFFITFGSSVSEQTVPSVPVEPGVVFPEAPVLRGNPATVTEGQIWVDRTLMQMRICLGFDDTGTPIIAGAPIQRTTGIVQQYRISEYTKLVFGLTVAFVVGFQTPVVVLLLGWAGIIDTTFLRGKRKYLIVGCLVVAAILTPADPLSMVILAVPLYLLFELGIVLMRVLPAERVAAGIIKREPPDAGDE